MPTSTGRDARAPLFHLHRHGSGERRDQFGARLFSVNIAIPLGIVADRRPDAVPMGHNKGKDNVKKQAARRKKNDRLALAKSKATAGSAK